ncbi:MAG: hypothetical protein ACK5CA_10900 [Cyanobacteriota bacterium]
MSRPEESDLINRQHQELLAEIERLKAEKIQLQFQFLQDYKEKLENEIEFQRKRLEKLEEDNARLNERNHLLSIKLSQDEQFFKLFDNLLKTMSQSSDSSQKISVGGDFNITATQSVVNLRDSVGAVNNAIEQIPGADSREGEDLKRLLQELTTAIELEASLDDEEKAEAVNQVKKIAQAAQKPEDQGLNAKAKRAVGFLETLAKGVEPAGKLAQTCAKALPWIIGLFP